MWEYRAAVLRVIDGDTLVALIDTGFYGRREEHLRLIDVSAPELSQPGGIDARIFVVNWVGRLPGTRWPLLVQTQPSTTPEPEERRTFTRYLAQVFDQEDNRWLNADVREYLQAHPEWS